MPSSRALRPPGGRGVAPGVLALGAAPLQLLLQPAGGGVVSTGGGRLGPAL